MKKLLLSLTFLVTLVPLVAFAQEEFVDAYNQGREALSQNRVDEAIEFFNRALQVDPQDQLSYNNRGVAYKRKGLYDKAIEDFNRALEIKPDYVLPLVNRGIARHKKGDLDGAYQDLTLAIKKSKRESVAYTALGMVEKDKGDLDHAIKTLRQAIALNKKNIPAYQTLGQIYEKQGNIEKAIAEYTKVIDLVKKPENAPEVAERITRLHGMLADNYYNEGLQNYRQGNEKQALHFWTQALKVDPGHMQSLRDRGLTYYKSGKYQKALEDFESGPGSGPR